MPIYITRLFFKIYVFKTKNVQDKKCKCYKISLLQIAREPFY